MFRILLVIYVNIYVQLKQQSDIHFIDSEKDQIN